MISHTCPECETLVNLDEPVRLSGIAECPGCSCELEVVSLDPLELALAPEIEEDWGE